MYRLVERADIFLHNFRPGVPEKLRVDFDTLHQLNPRLIYVYGSCFGSTGPWSHLPGFHSSPNAIVGTGTVEAGRGNPPQNRTFGDPAGAFALGASTLLALIARDRTGEGQYVEGTMLTSLAYAVSHYSVQGGDLSPPPLMTADQRGLSPWCRLYETADGWLALSIVTVEEQRALHRVLVTERAWSGGGEGESDEALQAALTEAFRSKGASDWEAQLLAAGVPAVRSDGINLFDFMLRSEQMRANGLVVEEEIEGIGTISRSTGCVEFSAAPHRIGTTVPLGHDTARVLGELGYDAEAIASLEASGVTRAVGQGLEA